MIAALSASRRGSRRAGFVFAREGVLALVDTASAAAAGASWRSRSRA